MKHFFVLATVPIFFLSTALPCHATGGNDHRLVVHTADGKRTIFADNPRLTISATTVTVTTAATKVCYETPDLTRFTLEDDSGNSVDTTYWLVISLHDGTIDAYPFTTHPKITFNDGTFTVSSMAHTIDYAISSIERFHLTDHLEGKATNADVNGDGSVDVADISTVISVMAGGAGSINPTQQDSDTLLQAADVNNDGIVDVADIASIIDVMASN